MEQDTRTTRDEYVVLARRYRPARFEEVIGQEHVTRTLQNAIRAGRVHHAYLFTGSRGVGKTTVARILARALNHPDGPTPEPPAPDASSTDLGLTDVIEIDGASHTGVDNVRDLRESVRYLPSQSRYKIYIIDEVHMLSTGAFNALLKTLEEPPAHVVFVFATTEPHKIPATILSRCQRFDFKRVPTDILIAHMERLLDQEGVSVDHAGLALIARAAEGGVRDSLSLLDQVIAYAGGEDSGDGQIPASQVAEVLGVADRRVLFALSSAVLEGQAEAALGVVDELFRDGHDLSQVAQAFTAHLRDLVVVASCQNPGPLVDATEAELHDLEAQARQANLNLLQQHFDRFAHAAEEIARSTFPRLLFEMALLDLVNAEPLLPLGDLLERLERLEQKLSTPGHEPQGGGPGGRGPGAQGRPHPHPSIEPLTFKAPPPRGNKKPRSTHAAPTPPNQEATPKDSAPPQDAPQGPHEADPPPKAPPMTAPSPEREEPTPPPKHDPPVDHAATSTPTPLSATSPSEEATPSRDERHTDKPDKPDKDATLARWRQLLERVGPPLATTFAAGHLISWEGASLHLGYAPDAFELSRAQDKKRQAAFAQRLNELLEHTVKLEISILTDEEQNSPELRRLSAIAAHEEEKRRHTEKLREEAKTHPITRNLIENFGAKILAIHVENDARAPNPPPSRTSP